MTLSNVHTAVLEKVAAQLPNDVEILKAETLSETQSVFEVKLGDMKRQVVMDKTDISKLVVGRKVTIEVKEDATIDSVYAMFSEKLSIPLLKGVDVPNDPSTVEFGEGSVLELPITILPSSISLYGTTQITVTKENRFKIPNQVLTADLDRKKIKLALAVSVLKPTTKVFSGDSLTNDFSKTVVDHLNEFFVDNPINIQDIQTSSVIDDLKDNVSRVVLIKMKDGFVLPIRYLADEKDIPTFKKVKSN